jgi:hypothetical protein
MACWSFVWQEALELVSHEVAEHGHDSGAGVLNTVSNDLGVNSVLLKLLIKCCHSSFGAIIWG